VYLYDAVAEDFYVHGKFGQIISHTQAALHGHVFPVCHTADKDRISVDGKPQIQGLLVGRGKVKVLRWNYLYETTPVFRGLYSGESIGHVPLGHDAERVSVADKEGPVIL